MMELVSEATLRARIKSRIKELGKAGGKTKAVYIPVDMADEVEGWVAEHRRIKAMLKEIDALAERLIKIHVPSRRRRERNIEAAAGRNGG